MKRSYYSNLLSQFLKDDPERILGELTRNHEFTLEEQQRNAWIEEIKILKDQLQSFDSGYLIFEYSIPRMGKRVDAIYIFSGIIFLLEFKVGEDHYQKYAKDQVLDYAVDLKNFQSGSHYALLVPILIATKADIRENIIQMYEDKVIHPFSCNASNIQETIKKISSTFNELKIDPITWENSEYKPTPTIIEAAQALYNGHSVSEISRSDSGASNLSKTGEAIKEIIERSKSSNKKSICFITGVPGAGKTLAGLNIANERHKYSEEEHAVFLSGNGPLVEVLQEALARNDVINSQKRISKPEALRKAKTFIQNIHHFRDEALRSENPPLEKVAVFDEAQRAWTHKRTSDFMKRRKGVPEFTMSEPEFLISYMDRHKGWAVIICLVGGGQEINTGEAGLVEWFASLRNRFQHWNVFISTQITDKEYVRENNLQDLFHGLNVFSSSALHLSTSIRSFRSENVSNFIKNLLDCQVEIAQGLLSKLKGKYPIVLTRDINKVKDWLKKNARGSERIGMTASSGALRLKTFGIFVQSNIEAKKWFLNEKDDVRSSFYLEDVATEFDIQGLELDWTCVAWDADLRFIDGNWSYKIFRGTKWQTIKDPERIIYLKNAYRVLLTRARQGLVIFIPEGDSKDLTRSPEFYDKTYNYLKQIGLEEI